MKKPLPTAEELLKTMTEEEMLEKNAEIEKEIARLQASAKDSERESASRASIRKDRREQSAGLPPSDRVIVYMLRAGQESDTRVVWRYDAAMREAIKRVPDHAFKGPIVERAFRVYAESRVVESDLKDVSQISDWGDERERQYGPNMIKLPASMVKVLDALAHKYRKKTRSALIDTVVYAYIESAHAPRSEPEEAEKPSRRFSSSEERERAYEAERERAWKENQAKQAEYEKKDAEEMKAQKGGTRPTPGLPSFSSQKGKMLSDAIFSKGCQFEKLDEAHARATGEYKFEICGKLPASNVCPGCMKRFCDEHYEVTDDRPGECPECDEDDLL